MYVKQGGMYVEQGGMYVKQCSHSICSSKRLIIIAISVTLLLCTQALYSIPFFCCSVLCPAAKNTTYKRCIR